MDKRFQKIKNSEIGFFLEDGGRVLMKAGTLELRDGFKNGVRSCVLINDESGETYLISTEMANALFFPFSIDPDLRKASTDLRALYFKLSQGQG